MGGISNFTRIKKHFWQAKAMLGVVHIILVLLLTLGPASYALAAPPAHAEKVEVLVSFKEKPGPAEQALIRNAGGKIKRSYHLVPAIAASVPKGKLNSLRNHPKVASVEEDIIVQTTEETLPWGVDRIDAEVVHRQNKGQGIKVAVLDTGIDLDHPDLRVAGDVSFVEGTTSGDDDHGHGTMVAGVIAALDNDIGVVGVAPEVELYAVKVLNNEGWGYCSDILSGIEWAIDHGMQVINMSFGSYLNLPSAVRTALDEAYQAGIVLVAAAGNAGDQGIIFSPARYESVIAVGATDPQDARASFSSTGSSLELMAPGTDIPSTSLGGGYSQGSGTSLSAPHVSGAAALLLASGVGSNARVRQILQGTAEDLGTSGWDDWYGWGVVNVNKALATPEDTESIDTIPPVTQIEIIGLKGNQGWYRSEVRVELSATDNPGGSGVAKTQYSLDGGKTWQTYQEPFTITEEGIVTILARSWDNAGNLEVPPVSREVKIDKTAPNVTISVSPTTIWPADQKGIIAEVIVSGSANDELSGLCSFELAVKDEYGEFDSVIGPYLERQIELEAWREGRDLDGRVYTISLTATDHAGNIAIAQAIVTVPHDQRKEVDSDDKAGKKTSATTSISAQGKSKNQGNVG